MCFTNFDIVRQIAKALEVCDTVSVFDRPSTQERRLKQVLDDVQIAYDKYVKDSKDAVSLTNGLMLLDAMLIDSSLRNHMETKERIDGQKCLGLLIHADN